MPRPPPVRRGGWHLRMDHGSQYLSDHFTNQIKFWGIQPSYAFVEQLQTNGVAERFNRTLKEQIIHGNASTATSRSCGTPSAGSSNSTMPRRIVEKNGYLSPAQARRRRWRHRDVTQAPPHETHLCPRNRVRYSDTFIGIEDIEGSAFDDDLTGDAGDNVLSGGAGLDTLTGAAGADRLQGGAGDDILKGGAGADTLDGDDGTDTADFSGSTAGVVLDLAAGTGSGGDATGDVLVEIENLQGSGQADTLTGDSSDNRLVGGAGDDTLEGGAGADTLDGGLGVDVASYAAATAGVTENGRAIIPH